MSSTRRNSPIRLADDHYVTPAPHTRAFQIVVADPPWKFGDSLPGRGRGAVKHYPCLTIEEIERFQLPPIANDALLFLWKVASMPAEALRVCAAWGFAPKSEIVWLKRTATGKRHFGMGRYVRASHETCIVASRGRGLDLVADHSIRSVFEGMVRRHSAKPESFYELVTALTKGRRVELFARTKRPGWVCLGNELEGAA